jgi:predicted Zn finger-like uncharacterized protein
MPISAMQIVCPNCSTAYEIPDAVFGGRPRKLRCENCGTQWRAGPAADDGQPGGVVSDAGSQPGVPPPAPEAGRVFGKSSDAKARAEFQQAMDRERQTSGPQAHTIAADAANDGAGDSDDSFINLVMAARSRAIEFEPEPPPEPRFKLTGPLLIGGLLVLFVLSVGFLLLHVH